MNILAIRGATTVVSNTKENILNETAKLVQILIKENMLSIDNIISMCFTMTNDLDKVYPSVAVRDILNITSVPMLNFEEKYIEGSLKMCIRIMMYINIDKNKSDIKHIYLNDAKNLRKDLANQIL